MKPEKRGSSQDSRDAAPAVTRKSPNKKHQNYKIGVNSPRRQHQHQQPLTIRMNLTEGQMNKLTEAITQRVDGSPVRPSNARQSMDSSAAEERMRSDHYTLPRMTYQNHQISRRRQDESPKSPQVVQQTSEFQYSPVSLAERRNGMPLPPIHTSSTGQPLFSQTEHHLPLHRELPSNRERLVHNEGNERESYYMLNSEIQPAARHADLGDRTNEAILNVYQSWANTSYPESYSEFPKRQQSLLHKTGRPESKFGPVNTIDASGKMPIPTQTSPSSTERSALVRDMNSGLTPSPQFSPLPLYFRGQSFPSAKKGEKIMIGQNGWLDCTSTTIHGRKPNTKRMGFIDSIKKIAKDVTAEINASYRRPNHTLSELTSPQLAISLDAREQSLLYCELEFHLTSSLNDYITSEFDRGHLMADNLKKVADDWLQRGRPRVLSCRYDLETQLHLVALHLDTFTFYGRRQSNPSEILGLLQAMKTNARAISIRTFCQPDTVIAKQLLDTQSLFDLLNVPHARQNALSEIAQFFKLIVERERLDSEVPEHTMNQRTPRGQRDQTARLMKC